MGLDRQGDEPIVDLQVVGYIVGYLLRSLRRRRGVVLGMAVVGGLALCATCVMSPRTYKVSTRVFTHRTLLMRNLVDPDNTIPNITDNPTEGVAELLKSRVNLEALLAETQLEESWQASRPPWVRGKEALLRAVASAPTARLQHEAFLALLKERITEDVDHDVVTLDVEWSDAEMAMRLAEATLARFRKMVYDKEMNQLVATVGILERNVEAPRQDIEQTVAGMQHTFAQKERSLQARGLATPQRTVVAIRRPQGATVAGGAQAQRAPVSPSVWAFEEQVTAAEEALATLRATLGPEHPDVLAARRVLDTLLMRAPVDTHRAEAPAIALEPPTPPAARRRSEDDTLMRVPVSTALYQSLQTDPELATLLDDIQKRQSHHDALLQRLASARIQTELADVAFGYRYVLTAPPVYPLQPVKPNLAGLLVAGLLGSLLLGIACAVAMDVLSRRVLEAWQLQRFLRLKVLGEVPAKGAR